MFNRVLNTPLLDVATDATIIEFVLETWIWKGTFPMSFKFFCSEAAIERVLGKKVFFKIFQSLQESTCFWVSC